MSFVLIAYNQEDFVEEAIAAAFAQDYPNLQIILSDDNSSDRTYELMQRAAEQYRGSHNVMLNRTRVGGEGLVRHFHDALRHADGELLVGAAGDDISACNRVSRLVDAWRGSGAVAIYSGWNRVDVEGNFLQRQGIGDQHDRDMACYFPDREVVITFGATAAYTTDFLRSFRVPETPIWSEDYFLSALAMLQGKKVLYLDEPLVSYRQNPKAQRNFDPTMLDFLDYERGEQLNFQKFVDLHEEFLTIAEDLSARGQGQFERDKVLRDLDWYRYRTNWPDLGFLQRLRATLRFRERERLRWSLPRLVGLPMFIRLKRAFRKW